MKSVQANDSRRECQLHTQGSQGLNKNLQIKLDKSVDLDSTYFEIEEAAIEKDCKKKSFSKLLNETKFYKPNNPKNIEVDELRKQIEKMKIQLNTVNNRNNQIYLWCDKERHNKRVCSVLTVAI